jgi:hypothetical protein
VPNLPIQTRPIERPVSLKPFGSKLKPGDRVPDRKRGQKMTASELRELRELSQTRYQLDIEIWEKRGVKDYQKDKVIEKMQAADIALLRIKH